MQAKLNKKKMIMRKLNDELIDKIVSDVERGSTLNLTSLTNGFTYDILKMWRRQGKLDLENDINSLCARLVTALGSVMQGTVISCFEDIRYNPKGHKGAEWILEHYYQEEFGKDKEIRELKELLDERLDAINEKIARKKE